MPRKDAHTLDERYDRMLEFELLYRLDGFVRIGGIDEAGRGPLAGPVVAACCMLDPSKRILGIDDSKKLTPARREALFEILILECLDYSIAEIDSEEIDRINILNATKKAMKLAVDGLKIRPDVLLVDAVDLKGTGIPVRPIIKGDTLSVSIAAASILAKVYRDRKMEEFDRIYPQYGFARHKGYGTPEHYAALRLHGLSDLHRRSFTRNLG
jgi:ribonuclease HII